MKILVTGFEPWGSWKRNPSGEVAQFLAGAQVKGYEVVSAVVPVVHGEDIELVAAQMAEHRPSAVVSLGLNAGACALNVEQVAVNLKVVEGEQGPVDLPVVEGGPAAYFSTLPVRAMVGRMRAAGVPAQVSYSAGTFLCNHLMYQVLHQMEEQEMKALAGFIHIPPLPEQVVSGGQGSMPVELVREGVLVGLEVVVEALDR